MDYTTVLAKAAQTLEQRKDRSAWDKGVTVYALEMVEQLAEAAEGGYIDADDLLAPRVLRKALLNGADDWSAYSWGGMLPDLQRRHCRAPVLPVRTQAHPQRGAQTQQPGRVVRHSSPRTVSGG